MNTLATTSSRKDIQRLGILIAFGALAVLCGRAQAAEPEEVTITGTKVQTIPYDTATRAPRQEITVTARVPANLDVLTLNSGVALLKDSVSDAAHKVCVAAAPEAEDYGDDYYDCVRAAIRGAQPQIDALVARARATQQG